MVPILCHHPAFSPNLLRQERHISRAVLRRGRRSQVYRTVAMVQDPDEQDGKRRGVQTPCHLVPHALSHDRHGHLSTILRTQNNAH